MNFHNPQDTEEFGNKKIGIWTKIIWITLKKKLFQKINIEDLIGQKNMAN